MDSSKKLNPRFSHAYGSRKPQVVIFNKPSRAKQEFKAECDINNIMKRYETTGQLTHLAKRSPMWGDVPSMDFQQSLQLVLNARADFAALPSAIRDRFANDPAKLLAFLQDANNREEGIRLGLIDPARGGKGGSAPHTGDAAAAPQNQSSGNPPDQPAPPARGG